MFIKCKFIVLTKKTLIIGLISCFFLFNSIASAAGAVEPTGPSEPVGPQQSTGVQEETGPIESVGPTPSPTPSVEVATQEITAENSNTGTDSANINEADLNSETDVAVENDTNINNQTNLDLNTGGNEIGSNTVVGDISTGSIDATVAVINIGDAILEEGSSIGTTDISDLSSGEITLIPSSQRIDLTNHATGPDSSNLNVIDDSSIVTILDDNDLSIDNSIEIDANTGENTVANNTVVGDLSTGDINIGVDVINLAELEMPNLILTIDVWNIYGDYNGDIVLANSVTGPDSENANNISTDNSLTANINQDTDINNGIDINATTGENEIGSGTVVGSINTGDTSISTSTNNTIDVSEVPMFYIFNVFGQWDGELNGVDADYILINEITADGSNNANLIDSNGQVITTIDNDTDINNWLTVNANTGKNNVYNNTAMGDIYTGSINISANIVNFVNSFSDSVGQFALGIVNIFGNWFGDVKGESEVAVDNPPMDQNNDQQVISDDSPRAKTDAKELTNTSLNNLELQENAGSPNEENQASDDNNRKIIALAGDNEISGGTSQPTMVDSYSQDNPVKALSATTNHKNSNSNLLYLIAFGVALAAGWIAFEILASTQGKRGEKALAEVRANRLDAK